MALIETTAVSLFSIIGVFGLYIGLFAKNFLSFSLKPPSHPMTTVLGNNVFLILSPPKSIIALLG